MCVHELRNKQRMGKELDHQWYNHVPNSTGNNDWNAPKCSLLILTLANVLFLRFRRFVV